jgi:NADPH-dependent 2,4-dienoyl-CoA reductase/sulfur reductase-like enzyme
VPESVATHAYLHAVHIVIIGNGISGITAARQIRKLSDHRITVISSESTYFFARTALMYVYMGHMRFEDIQPYEPWFWKKNRIDLVHAHVEGVNPQAKCLTLADGKTLAYDKLILALGSITRKYDWPGQDLPGVQGLYSYQDLLQLESRTAGIRHAVIVGGGLIGIELAEMLHSRGIQVTMLVREHGYWGDVLPAEESAVIHREIRKHDIPLKLQTELQSISGSAAGSVQDVVTGTGEHIPCDFVGITTGVAPNIALARDSGLECGLGVLVNPLLQTSDPDIFAIGDCAELRSPPPGRKAVEPLWYAGRIMGETVAYTLCGNLMPYEPGVWFNSAKFFSLEYQVYGHIPPNVTENIRTIYWQHPDETKCIRINFDAATRAVTGFNLLGVRYRHEVCEKWISTATDVEEVLSNLSLANFDSEFGSRYEHEVIKMYNRHFGKSVKLQNDYQMNSVIQYLQ